MQLHITKIIVSFVSGLVLFAWGIMSFQVYSHSYKKLKAARARKIKKDSIESIFLEYCLDSRMVDIIKSVVITLAGVAVFAIFIFVL